MVLIFLYLQALYMVYRSCSVVTVSVQIEIDTPTNIAWLMSVCSEYYTIKALYMIIYAKTAKLYKRAQPSKAWVKKV